MPRRREARTRQITMAGHAAGGERRETERGGFANAWLCRAYSGIVRTDQSGPSVSFANARLSRSSCCQLLVTTASRIFSV
jgi:hypothetical protein